MQNMPNPEESIGFLISDVARLMRRNFNRRVQDFGLSQAQWQALAYLYRQEGVKQVTLARLLDRLEDAGLVSRRPDPTDRRASRLYLTEKAKPLLQQMQEHSAITKGQATMDLSEAERLQLVHMLQTVKQSLLFAETRLDSELPPLTKSAAKRKKRA